MVVGLLGNESPDSNRFTPVTPKSENDVRLQATLGNQNPTGLPVGAVSEVGVDVPNATLILIMNAERFGLSQMHQLRGRVGRGDKLSFCVLVSKDTENENIKTLLETDDGFEIAEKDLKFLRKSGDLFGSEQSGRNKYIDEIVLYPNLYKATQNIAAELPSEVLLKHIERSEECEIRGRMRPITIDIEKKRKTEEVQTATF